MRFGTKILLLTLSIAVGLSGVVAYVVRRNVTHRETRRALDDITRSARSYFERLDAIQQLVGVIVQREMSDPNNRALLDSLTAGATPADRASAEEQLGGYIFPVAIQTELAGAELPPPAFHVLVNRNGEAVVATAHENPSLQATLKTASIDWHISQVLGADSMRREYHWISAQLYLVFAAPISQTAAEDPAFAYFAGFEVTDAWVRRLLDSNEDRPAVTAWFVVDGRVVARGSDRQIDPDKRRARIDALLQQVAAASRSPAPADVSFEVAGEPFVGQYSTFSPAPGVRGVLALACSMEEALAPLRALQRQIAVVTGVVALVAAVCARWISRRLAKPVEQLVEGTQRIAGGDFTSTINIRRRDEIGELARSFNEMAIGLAQRDLIKDTLGQFVDPRIADALLTNPASLLGQRAVQTVLFSDLEGFTGLSERLAPEKLVEVLNRFLGASADVVKELNGYLDKFVGDGVVAFWGPPVEQNHALAACRAALRIVELTRQFADPPLHVRIGIATGEAVVGIIGSERSKKNYTAMGDVVNLTSRLEGVNKVYGTQILVDSRTASEASSALVTRKIDVVRVIGRAEAVELYEVLGESGAVDGALRIEQYEQAMKLYASRDWSAARNRFAQIDDAPSRAMMLRCERFAQSAPEDSWDGVWTLDAK